MKEKVIFCPRRRAVAEAGEGAAREGEGRSESRPEWARWVTPQDRGADTTENGQAGPGLGHLLPGGPRPLSCEKMGR